ncbi:Doxorubicin resistance ATP-binding protein DrrA [Roseimaritima multifibrata]|uniref:Doxorubicin resistance ATP-binding protein DrrA n=1 Tax=Roseimaritima multifibrata TaxID=1930274 RepID=A0A517MEZ2_9BACT|nr:Doxorubicin resistance ATP-binding protein DrrA [Roseimaritima multifibrata]
MTNGNPTLALHADGLHKSYGSHKVLHGATLELRAGERLGLLGPNGAGKTTLIRCLTGRSRPDSGQIFLNGKELPPQGGREAIGLVPQELAIYVDLTTQQNLLAFGRFHGLSGRALRKQVDWALEWTGLQPRRKDLVGTFSGGMQRRVNLACGVLHRPQVLLLDEPTVGVDPQSRQRIFEMLDDLNDAGTSIVLTTHQLDEVETRCDRIVVFDRGQVIASGTLNDLIQQTVGSSRRIRLRAPAESSVQIPGWQQGPQPGEWTAAIQNVASELPDLLNRATIAGIDPKDIDIQGPSLSHVFLHLTGNELRD